MQSHTIDKQRTANATVKLEESELRFIESAENSLKEYKLDGLHITLEEFNDWATKLKTSPDAAMPACHK